MSESRLSDMSEAEFDAMIEGHLERMARGDRELEADVFVDLLLERIAAKAEAPVTLAIDVHGDQLVITPDSPGTDIVVQGNEILIGGRRLVLRLVHQPTS
ncbi:MULTISPECIES: hypothetical protein [Candidatus Chloroploca]|uniref:Uncharacterized protein n=1 Tax=Candidatus Chloroploca asiatica TaxID=1506545 RepID=A0A2H3L2T0_9CHLR|nr:MULTISPECIES: hypothetical protein [Candidatus Chloroploca]PDV96520.1 hypothetical protein A9Q02_20730 [Candidatus Chloroploca asiatica]